ncbi:hypothetical protein GGR56DRAFT_666449 [Xylariaceae sp. FL0804]|nr:hypothetical protein GGR56DRAFT_666449 [Xylariaceae sp. FL0804]
MGIQGLLPLLKSIHRPIELKKHDGKTLGVDAYGWLHRGATSCAIELAKGEPTRKYVDSVMNRVRMAKHHGVKLYLVFDGDFLPSKAGTEASRLKRREEARKAGLELLKAGKPSQAHLELQKAIDVTPEMAWHLIQELKKHDISYVVAPYEADAQLIYLEREGIIDGIISEDSDLLVFGAKRLLTKLDQHGQCVEINRRDFCACREVSLTGWTDAQFRQMAILSGCDYLEGIHKLGLKTAHRMIRQHKTPEKVVRMLQFNGKFRVPADYLTLFDQAEKTFLYQWVFCPRLQELVHLNALPTGLEASELPFIGSFLAPARARNVALGDVNPITKQKITVEKLPSPRKRAASAGVRDTSAPGSMPPPPVKPIDAYFSGHRRIPLGAMEPNCFSVEPGRRASDGGGRPIVFPLPRPYLDDATPATSATSRTYISQTGSLPHAARRRTEPVSNLLGDGGHSLVSNTRRRTAGPDVRLFNASNNVIPADVARPPKKQRLCDAAPAAIPGKEKSRFFPGAGTREAAVSKPQGYLMSDDSIEEALKELPDVDGWRTEPQNGKTIAVHREESSQPEGISKDDEQGISAEYEHADSSGGHVVVPDTPPRSDIRRFAYATTAASQSTQQMPEAMRRSSSNPTTRKSINSLTPASIVSSTMPGTPRSIFSQTSTAKSTPATARMTPLQRLGSRALARRQQLSTLPVSPPRQPKRPNKDRRSLDSFPINPAFVPLPPVDLDELEALNEAGSEDLLVPDSDSEEAADGTESSNLIKQEKDSKKMDLSRFLFA